MVNTRAIESNKNGAEVDLNTMIINTSDLDRINSRNPRVNTAGEFALKEKSDIEMNVNSGRAIDSAFEADTRIISDQNNE